MPVALKLPLLVTLLMPLLIMPLLWFVLLLSLANLTLRPENEKSLDEKESRECVEEPSARK